MRNLTRFTTVCLVLFGVLGCTQPTPLAIFVTATPEPQAVTAFPTVILPTSPTPPASENPLQPTVTFMGSVVQPGYIAPTVPPTVAESTPTPLDAQPTVSPILPTDVFSATQTPMPLRSGTSLPPLDTSKLGIQTISFLGEEDWREVIHQVDSDLQMSWLKLQISWEFYQPNNASEITEDFRRLEIFLEQARQQQQIKVLISIVHAPDWARTSRTDEGPPDDPQALANFISLLLNEMGQGIDAVEVWNEPNLIREWTGQPMNGAQYMRYFSSSYDAIRAFSPNITVVSAGLAPVADLDGTRDDRAYLREMYSAGLADPRYQNIAVGVHPYGWGNPPDSRCCDLSPERGWDEAPQFFFLNTLDDYRQIMNNSGHSAVTLWVTEFGWATWEGLPGDAPEVWMTYNDKWDQANYGLRAIEIMNSRSDIGAMFLWNLNFAQPILIEQRNERASYSIVLPEGVPRERPLYWMLYDAVRPNEELARYD